MKKSLATLLLVTFIVVAFTGKSWAFGSRGHHHSGSGSSDSGDSFFSDNNGNSDNTDNNGFNSDFILPNDPGTNSDSDSGEDDHGDHKHHRHHDHDFDGNFIGNSEDPHATPVPEPMSLSLLGTGLAGIFLRRKKS